MIWLLGILPLLRGGGGGDDGDGSTRHLPRNVGTTQCRRYLPEDVLCLVDLLCMRSRFHEEFLSLPILRL